MNKFALLLLALCAAPRLLGQNYPLPGAAWEPLASCTGCPGTNSISGAPNDGAPTYPYTLPFGDHVGRLVDSSTTPTVQNVGMRTVRAGRMRTAPDGARLYVALGETIGAYSTASLFTEKLRQPMVAVNTIDTDGTSYGGRSPFEKLAKPDAFFYAETGQSGWQTSPLDVQVILSDFDADDRGHVYVATTVYGWGIAFDDARTDGTHMPFVGQFGSPGSSAPQTLVSLKNGTSYYVVMSRVDPGSGTAYIEDVTTPTAPALVATRAGTAHGFRAWAKNAAGDRLALINADGHVRIYSTAGYVAAEAALADVAPTAGHTFADTAFDDDGNLWVAETTASLTTNVLWRLAPSASTYTATTFDVYGEAFRPSSLHAAADYVAVYGSVAGTVGTTSALRLFRTDGAGISETIATDDFFRKYYKSAPEGYAQTPTQVKNAAVFPRIIANGDRTYLVFNSGGLGDVYQFDDGSPVVSSLAPATGPPSGGNIVTIYGRNFGGSRSVAFGGTTATASLVNATTISATAPSHEPGPAGVVVSVTGESPTIPEAYTYVLASPSGFAAAGQSASSVSLSWNAVTTATTYEVQRRATDGSWSTIATPAVPGATDGGRDADSTYVYRVRALDGYGYASAFTGPEWATTVVFTSPVISPGMPILAPHVLDLRRAVNAARSAASLPPASFTDTLTPAVAVKGQHVLELRDALAAARSNLGLTPVFFTDPSTLASVPVKALHFQQLIDACR